MPRKHGMFSDFTEYRYGRLDGRRREVKVKMPSISFLKKKRAFQGAKLDAAVKRTADQLRDWHFNRWEHEGHVLQGLRSAIALSGYRWAIAEAEAEDIVRRAFNSLNRGANTRPTWWQGQAEFTIAHENCKICNGPLSDEDMANGRRFCSDVCATSARVYREELFTHASNMERATAFDAARKALIKPRPCEHCGTDFRPASETTRFCSPACATMGRTDIEHVVEKPCECCGTLFKGRTNSSRFCSIQCIAEFQRAQQPERQCEECGETFKPAKATTKYCSSKCRSRKWARDNRKAKATT